jgi:hypothetical protein
MLLGGASAWSFAAHAQQRERMWRIGLLLVSGPEPWDRFARRSATLDMLRARTSRSRFDRHKARTIASLNWRPGRLMLLTKPTFTGSSSPSRGCDCNRCSQKCNDGR